MLLSQMPELRQVIAKLEKHYEAPTMPTAKGPFELVIGENACYLLPDERRAAVFEGLRKQVGLTASAILEADPEILLPLATMGACARMYGYFDARRVPESP